MLNCAARLVKTVSQFGVVVKVARSGFPWQKSHVEVCRYALRPLGKPCSKNLWCASAFAWIASPAQAPFAWTASSMKTGIIGLPQVGKTSLFKILTRAKVETPAYSNPREAHLGVAKVPDDRLDKLAALYNPKKIVYATVEYADVAAIGQEALKESAFLTHLRDNDALIHVLCAFEDDSIPRVGGIDPLRDIKNVDFDLIFSDLTQVEKRLERLEKDLKKMRTPDLEKEHALLLRCKQQLEQEKPLREMEMSAEEKKVIRGFMFLSQKPMLFVLNIAESTTLGADLESAVARYKLEEIASRPNAGATAICGKVEAELAEMSEEEAAEFLSSYGLVRKRPAPSHSQNLRTSWPGSFLYRG